MPHSPYWDDPERLNEFDLSMEGARRAFDRLGESGTDEDRLLSYREVLYWLGAAIELMNLHVNSSSIYAGVRWVRNRSQHEQWQLMALTPRIETTYGADWYFDDPSVIGYDDLPNRDTQRWGYMRHLEGHSVRQYLFTCFLELQHLRDSMVTE